MKQDCKNQLLQKFIQQSLRQIARVSVVLLCLSVFTFTFISIGIKAVNAQEAPIGLVVNGHVLADLPMAPVIRQDRMLVPARAVFENLGATVEWQPAERVVYIQYQDQNVLVTIGRNTLVVNGQSMEMPVPAQIINDNTMIPVGAVAVNLGFNVDFRDRTVFVDSPNDHDLDNDGLDNEVIPSPEVQVEFQTEDQLEFLEDQLEFLIEEQMEFHTEEQTEFQSEDQIEAQGEAQIEAQVETQVEVQENQEGEANSNTSTDAAWYTIPSSQVPVQPAIPSPQAPVQPTIPSSHIPSSQVPVHPNVMVPAGQFMPARDLSTMPIPTLTNFQPATIFSVWTPHEIGPQIYTIVAASPITGVERVLMEDNRLVIDIINSTTTLSGAMPVPPSLSVTGIRVSQFTENVTRVVFELESGTDFSIDISPDRTTIFLTIHQQTLTDFTFHAMEGHDVIVLQGINQWMVRAGRAQGSLRFYLSGTQLAVTADEAVEGGFANHLSLNQLNTHTALLELLVNDFTAHTITQTGPNETTIHLHPATYRNIHYDFAQRTFRIPRTSELPLHVEHAVRFDMYHNRQFILLLPVDAMELLGFGEVLIADHLLRSVNIVNTGQATQLIFNGNQIFTLDVLSDEYYYYIRVMHPRERYPRIVIIDPGHGGTDPGAVRSGIRESDLNMIVTNKLLQLIDGSDHIRAYTTRNSDINVSLQDRPALGNPIGDIFVSIHFNSATNTGAQGVETYYRPSELDSFRMLTSRNLAEIMHRHQLTQLGSNDREVRSANFAVLRYSTIPAVLLEMGFMSNPQELARISTPEFQWAAARAIYNALHEAFMWVPAR